MSAESEKYSPILDGTFFDVKQVKDGKVTARCVNCVGNKQMHGTLEATSNFLQHLKVSGMHRLGKKTGSYNTVEYSGPVASSSVNCTVS